MALRVLAGVAPEPRRATRVRLRDPRSGEPLDDALAIRFPGPNSATGDDIVELHLHGGRAVIDGVLSALGECTGLRPARAGEFTRRAFRNGRIDLAEAEGLADLLRAETAGQRRAALMLAGGALGRLVEGWRGRLLALAAEIEALIEFSDEGDVGELPSDWTARAEGLRAELDAWLARPAAERLRDGVRVVLAGPPNSGKSSLLNAICQREAAIVSPVPGTTRDLIEVPLAIAGVPIVLIDTAGLRETGDAVEAIGVERAEAAAAAADVLLWLGDAEAAPAGDQVLLVHSKGDLGLPRETKGVAVSAVTGVGIPVLVGRVAEAARRLLPAEGELALSQRHREHLAGAGLALAEAIGNIDLVLRAEALRAAMVEFDALAGRAGVEDMLDAVFTNFCVGK